MTGVDPDQLRHAVVQATVPRLGDHATLTTAEIAHAAGVGEAELLTVFADKEAVLQACVTALTDALATAFDPAAELRQLAAIRTDQPLPARLVEVIGILDAYHDRIRLDALPLLRPPGPGPADTAGAGDDLRTLVNRPEFRQAVARLLEPDEHHLRLPAAALAEAFIGLTSGVRPRGPDGTLLPAGQLVDLFLHGAGT